MNSGCASHYFGRRSGRKYRRYPKVSAVVDVNSHLVLGAVIDRGPKPDDVEFERLARQAHGRQPFDALLGDAGYDGEDHHAFLWRHLAVLGIIPPARGRPPKDPEHIPRGFFRSFIAQHWPKELYGQRWQAETNISMFKRLLSDDVRSRGRHNIDREIFLRIVTLNLMIVLLSLLTVMF